MRALLMLCRVVDTVTGWVGKAMMWLVLVMVLISAGNAISRKAFNLSSNAYLEVQWYLFAAVFMLAAGYVFLHNNHVRIDFIAARLSERTNAIIDAIGIVVFLIPLCVILIDLSWPFFMRAYVSGEMSENAGGLIRWPVIFMIPLGFALLLVQSLSELVKRIAFVRGDIDSPFSFVGERTPEEELLAEMGQAAQGQPGGKA